MFQELMPLLEKRVLILTLSRVGAEEICVNVIPKPVKANEQEENNAMRTPLSLTGTPQELDRELPRELAEFVDSHLQLSSTLQMAKMEMDAAAKAAQDAAKKSSAKSRSYSKPPSNPDTDSLPEAGNPETSTLTPSTPSTTGSLFAAAPAPQG